MEIDYKKLYEETKKLYDDTLEKAKEINDEHKDSILGKTIEYLFPQLKESEDERIRKDIIETIKKESEDFPSSVIAKKSHTWIAWFEKQGEKPNNVYDKELSEILGRVIRRYINDPNISYTEREKVSRDIIPYIERLEKQGKTSPILSNSPNIGKVEQKPAVVIPKFSVGDVMRTLQEAADNITSGLPVVVSIDKEYYHCTNESIALKNQGDYEYPPMNRTQKPADKVEPKFHEGEWLCENEPNNYARFIQILEIVNVQGKERYRISRDIHNDEDIVEFDFVEKHYHKFGIQDAKDGDVLASGEVVFVFKVIHGVWLNCHYSAHKDGSFNADSYDLLKDKYFGEVYPATKEQRDFLFQKMKGAGYEWDAEKKELKLLITNGGDFCSESENCEQKPAWSEEDESKLREIRYALYDCYTEGNAEELMNWIKTLYNDLKKL